jgi:hypothetical protein
MNCCLDGGAFFGLCIRVVLLRPPRLPLSVLSEERCYRELRASFIDRYHKKLGRVHALEETSRVGPRPPRRERK